MEIPSELHSYSFYDRSKLKWTFEESQQLKMLYEENNLDIIRCANALKRTPGCISYKLKSQGIIAHPTLARGYTTYKISPLYSEVVESCKKDESDSRNKPSSRNTSSLPSAPSLTEQFNAKESQLRAEVEFYKTNMEQLVRIYALEKELESLKASVARNCEKQMRENIIMKDFIIPCREHIQKIFPAIITLWMHGDRKKAPEYIALPKLSNGSSPGNVHYTLEHLGDSCMKCSATGSVPSNIIKYLSGIWNGHQLIFQDPVCTDI